MPKSNPFKRESELQALLRDAIQGDALADLISDVAGIRDMASPRHEENVFPVFSIDHLVRWACLTAGADVLDSLNMLILLTDDKNVSFAVGEIMRPDLVCVNPERECLIIFELKKVGQTGRQAITELLAYEHEIKNLLPFLSNYDVHFVLVSPEWSTLMDHSVASAIAWSGRKVLCLEAGLDREKLTLATRIPPAWTITGSVYFPDDALTSVTICLYEKDAYSRETAEKGGVQKAEDIDPRIWTAMDIMAREGDRIGSHGFALLWRDHLGMSLTSYNITVVGVAPFPFYRESRLRQDITDNANELVRELDKYLVDHDPQGHSASLMEVAQAAFPLLTEVADPHFEQFSTWSADQVGLRKRAEPLLCEFWGELGTYARAYVTHPGIRKYRPNVVHGGKGDWRTPGVGLPLIASFTRPQIFSDGDVRCSDAFRLGVLIGLDELTRFNIRKGNKNPELECLFKWNCIELMSALDEVALLASAATNVEAPREPLNLSVDPLKGDQKDMQNLLEWLGDEFLQKEPLHIGAMHIGIRGALAFEREREGIFRQELPPEFTDVIAASVRQITRAALEHYKALAASGELPGYAQDAFRFLIRMLGLRQNFAWKSFDALTTDVLIGAWIHTVEAIDSVVPAVFHRHAPITPTNADWSWLRQGVTEMRARGIRDAGVILLPNGQLVTGSVFPEGFEMSIKLDDPDKQVPYLDRSNGIGFMRVTTWTELETLIAAGAGNIIPTS